MQTRLSCTASEITMLPAAGKSPHTTAQPRRPPNPAHHSQRSLSLSQPLCLQCSLGVHSVFTPGVATALPTSPLLQGWPATVACNRRLQRSPATVACNRRLHSGRLSPCLLVPAGLALRTAQDAQPQDAQPQDAQPQDALGMQPELRTHSLSASGRTASGLRRGSASGIAQCLGDRSVPWDGARRAVCIVDGTEHTTEGEGS